MEKADATVPICVSSGETFALLIHLMMFRYIYSAVTPSIQRCPLFRWSLVQHNVTSSRPTTTQDRRARYYRRGAPAVDHSCPDHVCRRTPSNPRHRGPRSRSTRQPALRAYFRPLLPRVWEITLMQTSETNNDDDNDNENDDNDYDSDGDSGTGNGNDDGIMIVMVIVAQVMVMTMKMTIMIINNSNKSKPEKVKKRESTYLGEQYYQRHGRSLKRIIVHYPHTAHNLGAPFQSSSTQCTAYSFSRGTTRQQWNMDGHLVHTHVCPMDTFPAVNRWWKAVLNDDPLPDSMDMEGHVFAEGVETTDHCLSWTES